MARRYSDILISFKAKREMLNELDTDYSILLQACCKEFFDDIEKLPCKKIIDYIKEYDLRSPLVRNKNDYCLRSSIMRNKNKYDLKPSLMRNKNEEVYISNKDLHILYYLMVLTIDKYGIDSLVKDLFPDVVHRLERNNLFYFLINFFISLFRKTKISIKDDSDLNIKLSEAVINLRGLKDGKGPYSLDRGQDFVNSLSFIYERIFKKYAQPLDNFFYFKKNLTDAAVDTIIVENGLRMYAHEWSCMKSEISRSNTIYSSFSSFSSCSDHIYEEISDEIPLNDHTYENRPYILEISDYDTKTSTDLAGSSSVSPPVAAQPEGKKPAIKPKPNVKVVLQRKEEALDDNRTSDTDSDYKSGFRNIQQFFQKGCLFEKSTSTCNPVPLSGLLK